MSTGSVIWTLAPCEYESAVWANSWLPVYTTTFRRLEDPTASRLEAFWWHVMGSDRRFLSGKALAKMFEEISTGPSFAPLRGPPNRFPNPASRLPLSCRRAR